jgi:phosphoribosylformylglycinamidine cyclo-ligase
VLADRHGTIGIDLVAMGVNDVLVHGAEPLYFLDYVAVARIDPPQVEAIVAGVAEGCRQAGCALIGGETAEMPSFYKDGEYDLAGFAVGVVDKPKIIDGSTIQSSDVLIGLASTGLHSNGYSLARRVLFEDGGMTVESRVSDLDRPLGEILLAPTRIYAKAILALVSEFEIKGIAHITGGGLTENLPRVLPHACRAVIHRGSWPVPTIFRVLQKVGMVDTAEMYRVFNMGIGLVLVVPSEQADRVIARAGELGDRAFRIGEIVRRDDSSSALDYVGEDGTR